MLLRFILIISLLSPAIGCAGPDNCDPTEPTQCIDDHQMTSCRLTDTLDDGHNEAVYDCRELLDGDTPYCVSLYDDDGSYHSAGCRSEPADNIDTTRNQLDAGFLDADDSVDGF